MLLRPRSTLAFARPFRTNNSTGLTQPSTVLAQHKLVERYLLNPRLNYKLQNAQPFHSTSTQSSAIAAAISVASKTVSNAMKTANIVGNLPIDPLRLVSKEMRSLTGNIRKLLGTGHPSLDRVAKYYTQSRGKHIRPMIVLLMSRAVSVCPKAETAPSNHDIDVNIAPNEILIEGLPDSPLTSFIPDAPAEIDEDILPAQRRLAEITELLHTASLLHDDVIDGSESRRGEPSANHAFGNKMAVLAGDFLLGRASVALARLRNPEVVELLSTVIANLVEGEFMQLKNTAQDEKAPVWTEDTLNYYLQKTYLKTASLVSMSCRASALLGGASAETVELAYTYGKNLGLAFQLVDDLLDYTQSHEELGKPAGADLELGLATAPLLFAWKTNPELGTLVGRKFSQEGDVTLARKLVLESDGVEQTRALAQSYHDKAVAALANFPESEAKQGLINTAANILKRKH
ncbi:putative hexaprenyl pyrophosphate synthase, mitochondrial [Ceratocystis fimbriata CBS 114723]|uniref:Putative hexaprenyl pyrophosphate synthase, mitochondrial n=1 Tax=Ceratocystis fimbriata CBS 114723 TaxID=1035309 RepID=A0A2C5XEC5_9PEZI|nr:putative hexaprenyl pyrophosphate synthase, mitochondrial [Ceratocystis fimbriata CBS 114723]